MTDLPCIADIALVTTPGRELPPAFGMAGDSSVVTIAVTIFKSLLAGPGHLFAVTEITMTTNFTHAALQLTENVLRVSHGDSCYPVSDKPRMSWRSQREGLIARPKQRDTLFVETP